MRFAPRKPPSSATGSPFELLAEKLIPEQIGDRAGGKLRIWSVACSNGQEAFSIAVVVAESDLASGWQVEIQATDLSESALDRARAGRFSGLEVERGLSTVRRQRYFEQDDDGWRANVRLRDMVTFSKVNVLHHAGNLGRFDIIFCRNLASYFDLGHRHLLFARLQRQLQPSGALVLGATETLVGITDRFALQRSHGSSYYTHSNG